jgi:hypothetical protein
MRGIAASSIHALTGHVRAYPNQSRPGIQRSPVVAPLAARDGPGITRELAAEFIETPPERHMVANGSPIVQGSQASHNIARTRGGGYEVAWRGMRRSRTIRVIADPSDIADSKFLFQGDNHAFA